MHTARALCCESGRSLVNTVNAQTAATPSPDHPNHCLKHVHMLLVVTSVACVTVSTWAAYYAMGGSVAPLPQLCCDPLATRLKLIRQRHYLFKFRSDSGLQQATSIFKCAWCNTSSVSIESTIVSPMPTTSLAGAVETGANESLPNAYAR